jgi:hypothetical protein
LAANGKNSVFAGALILKQIGAQTSSFLGVDLRKNGWIVPLILLLLSAMSAPAQTTCRVPAFSSLTDYWEEQAACTLNGAVQAIDPCSCPTTSGYAVAALPGNSKLPYHKTDQNLTSYVDSYRVVEPWGGNALSVYPQAKYDDVTNPFLPFSVFENANSTKWPELTQANFGIYFVNVDSGTIGYHDWATSTETQNCTAAGETLCIGTYTAPNNYEVPGGWIEFPASFITSTPTNGATGWAQPNLTYIRWQREPLVWPGYVNPTNPPYVGACQVLSSSSAFDNIHETYWTYYSDFTFGGLSTASQKIIPAIQSVHGFPTTVDAYNNLLNTPSHFEITYWSQLYGHTRWEAWYATSAVTNTPPTKGACGNAPGSSLLADAEDVVSSGRCSVGNGETLTGSPGSQTITATLEPANYSALQSVITSLPSGGIPMTMVSCGDYTNVPTPVADATPPLYPIPDLNLLQNYDFAVTGSPNELPTCSATSTQCWYVTGSTTTAVAYSSLHDDAPKTNYLQVTCGTGTCTVQQSVPASWYQEPSGNLYTLSNGTFLIGATARTEADNGVETTNGAMMLTLANGSNSFTLPSSSSWFTVDSNTTYANTYSMCTTSPYMLCSIAQVSTYFGLSTYPDTLDPNTDVILPPSADKPFMVTSTAPLTLTITLKGGVDSQNNALVYDILNGWLERASY